MAIGCRARLIAIAALVASGGILIARPSTAGTPPAPSASLQALASKFVSLFHDSCMVYMGQDQSLNATLGSHGFKILPADAAADFLQGVTGLAWTAPRRVGEFVVALRDDGSCAVFARKVGEADVQAQFDEMTRATASPLPVVRQPDRVESSSDGPFNVRTYLQGRPGSTSAIQLTLETNASAAAHQQAIATLSLVERPASSEPSPTVP